MPPKKNVVVLGAGFGGLRAAMDVARGLARMKLLDRYEVTLVDRNDCHVFIPLLYKVAARPEPEHEDNCSYDIASLVADLPLTFIQGEVIMPNPVAGSIALSDGRTLNADYLVFALGSETNYFGIAGLKEHALELKTLESAAAIRAALTAAFAKGGDVQVVAGGGGPNGIELAAEIRQWANKEEKLNPELHVGVSIVEAMPTLLPGFAPRAVAIANKRLAKLKVKVMSGMKITSVSEKAITASGGQDGTGAVIPFTVFVWTGGTKTPDLLAPIPIEKDGRGRPVAHGPMMCLPPATSNLQFAPMVYAAGDNICFTNPKTGKPVPAVAHVAILEGAIAAHNVLEDIRHAERPSYIQHATFFAPKDYPWVIPIGENWAVAKFGPFIFKGWPAWEFGRLVEFNYLLMIMPFGRAFKAWQRMERDRGEHDAAKEATQ